MGYANKNRKNGLIEIRICSAAQIKPLTNRGLYLKNYHSAKTVPTKYTTYRPPKIVKGKRWYIEYYYRRPEVLASQHPAEWVRFRVFEDINRYKTDEYAEHLLRAVTYALENGFNPFEQEEINAAFEGGGNKQLTIKDALEGYLKDIAGRGLEEETIYKYKAIVEIIRSYFAKLLNQPAERVQQHHIKNLLKSMQDSSGFGNRQYNNYKSLISSVFNWMKDNKIIPANPVDGIKSKKTVTHKHQYYDRILFPKVLEVLKAEDSILHFAALMVYYLAVRSSKELRLLKIGDIVEDGHWFRFRAEVAKSDREELVPVPEHFRPELLKLLKHDPSYYIFGAKGKPAPRPVNSDYFSKRFRKIRNLAGISQDHTLYGFKHTRAVHLIRDGAKLADVMRIFRHRDIGATTKYLRDLGVDFDPTDVQAKTRRV